MRALEPLSRPLAPLRVLRPDMLPEVADAPARDEPADLAPGHPVLCPHFVLVAAVVLQPGDVEEPLAAHVARDLGQAVRRVTTRHVLIEVQLQYKGTWLF